jgi:hypothetical protein
MLTRASKRFSHFNHSPVSFKARDGLDVFLSVIASTIMRWTSWNIFWVTRWKVKCENYDGALNICWGIFMPCSLISELISTFCDKKKFCYHQSMNWTLSAFHFRMSVNLIRLIEKILAHASSINNDWGLKTKTNLKVFDTKQSRANFRSTKSLLWK